MSTLDQNTTNLQTVLDTANSIRSDIATSLTNKGVTVPDGTKLDGMAALIEGIETGPSVSGEIAITANGTYDVTKYASANVNVQSAPVLLWTNASPTSAFNAQTISVNGGSYDAYLVEIAYQDSNLNFSGIGLIKKTSTLQGVAAFYSTSAAYMIRYVTNATSSSITFGAGQNQNVAIMAANQGVPTRIWGVKFTL